MKKQSESLKIRVTREGRKVGELVVTDAAALFIEVSRMFGVFAHQIKITDKKNSRIVVSIP